MLSRTHTATMLGLQPLKIEVEVDGNRGTPALILIGLPTKEVEEAKERITAALTNCGIRIRSRRTIVNLAPADVKKTGSSFELAIAIGLLKMYGEITHHTDDTIFFGELSLDGDIKPVRGALPLVLSARELGFTKVVLPKANLPEVNTIRGLSIYAIDHLREYLDFCQEKKSLPKLQPQPFVPSPAPANTVDFGEIAGQVQAKRALEIAAAGAHNVLLTGPPGAGKSLMAKALASILPPLTEGEALEVTQIYSVCGLVTNGLITHRPFRAPHHTTSQAGLIGGSASLRPGEVSLAHRGILFLDELSEFSRDTIESLRQPLEDGVVTISRAHGTVTYPAAFTLVGATNPCACGYFGSTKKACNCSMGSIAAYHKRISGPMMDRIDLRVFVRDVDVKHLSSNHVHVESSVSIRQRVIDARNRQQARLQNTSFVANAAISAQQVHVFCPMTNEAKGLLHQAMNSMQLSARSYFKLIKISQTIADLAAESVIHKHHLAEALQYRQ